MKKADNYIGLIADMYSLTDKVQDKLYANADLIEKEFENYNWEDIKWAIQKYYAYKNDKTYPKLCHILAILDSAGKKLIKEEPLPDIKKPATKINELKDVFEKVCLLLYSQGVFWNEYFAKVKDLPFGNKSYIDEKTGKIMNKQWIWDDSVATLQRNYPQEYNKFKYLTLIEKYALAYKWGCYNV